MTGCAARVVIGRTQASSRVPDDQTAEVAASLVQAPLLAAHRALYRLAGGRVLWAPEEQSRLGRDAPHDAGRRSGEPRGVIVGYLEDGSTPFVLAMNGWDEGRPAWWRNLEAHPDAVIRLKGQPERQVQAPRVDGEERDRLWRQWAEVDGGLDAYAASRSAETPVVVFEARDTGTDQAN